MAFSDPQSVTIGSTPGTVSLPRTASSVGGGVFDSNDGTVELSVANSYGKRTRRTARINLSKIAPDPLISSNNIKYSSSVYVVVDAPVTGFTVAELKDLMTGLTTWLTASSGAHITQLLGGEN
jgi:hypothetical protein